MAVFARHIITCSLACFSCIAASGHAAQPASKVVKQGDKVQPRDHWEYERRVSAPRTPAERVEGLLLRNGKRVTGIRGQIIDTPKGRFMYFNNPKRSDNQGWLNTLTNNTPVFDADGALSAEFRKKLENALPLKLHKPAGEPPAMLGAVKVWESRVTLNFTGGNRYRYLKLNGDHAVRWSKDVHPPAMQKLYKKKPVEQSPKQMTMLLARSSLLAIGGEYGTYRLDTKNKTLLLRVLVEVGKNKWYYAVGTADAMTEILFEFDKNPIESKRGTVRITRPGHAAEKIAASFQVDHHPSGPNKDHEQWIVNVEGGPHSRYFMEYRRFDTGLAYFTPMSSWGPVVYRPSPPM